jgi:hypothetical protein
MQEKELVLKIIGHEEEILDLTRRIQKEYTLHECSELKRNDNDNGWHRFLTISLREVDNFE